MIRALRDLQLVSRAVAVIVISVVETVAGAKKESGDYKKAGQDQ